METAALIWMTCLLAIATATLIFAMPRRFSGGPRAVPREAADRYAGQAAEAADRAADRAAEVARRRRAAWERAQDEVDAAWEAFDAADRDARRCAAAAVFPIFKQRRTRAEIADRERFLHTRALTACRERELSMEQLNEVLAHRGGWNARKHPVAQETALRAAVREHRLAGYQAATERERIAWRDAELAAAELRELRTEALAATIRMGRDVRSLRLSPQVTRQSVPEPAPRAAPARLAVH
ncbi:hypothetical protein [Actinoplanes sp. NPDC051494]|uniref:hypothetical protein n=1 Tax=Actinoplanes sp. NPDC051494 TaxID=3363907 RepID=UPI0037A671F6